MKILTPSRVIAAVALALATLSFGVAYAGAGSSGNPPEGAGQACVHGTALLERNKNNVVAYYETAVNDKNPRLAVQLYGGDEYIQHNPLANNGFDSFIAFFEGFEAAFPNEHRHQARYRRVRSRRDARDHRRRGTELVFGPRGTRSSTSSGWTQMARSSSTGTCARRSPRPPRTVIRRSERQRSGLAVDQHVTARPDPRTSKLRARYSLTAGSTPCRRFPACRATSTGPPPTSRVLGLVARDRCVVLDGGIATELQRVAAPGRPQHRRLSAHGRSTRAPRVFLDVHRSYALTGCDVISTDTWSILSASELGAKETPRVVEAQYWMDLARWLCGWRDRRLTRAVAPGSAQLHSRSPRKRTRRSGERRWSCWVGHSPTIRRISS